jgi:SAM-dependent methyltransferase
MDSPSATGAGYRVETWQSAEELADADFAGYWNDVEEERSKEWWVSDGDFSTMEEYLITSGLVEQLELSLDLAERIGHPVRGVGADLAAGNLWAVPRLIARGAKCVRAVEYSRHRLLDLGPLVLRHYDVSQDAVILCRGSFYDLHVPDSSLDFVFMSQAFHHAADPMRLLAEVRRVIRPGGVVSITGEHVIDHPRLRVRNSVASLLALLPSQLQTALFRRTLARRPLLRHERPAPDPVLGDHYYYRFDYERMFRRAGFTSHRVHRPGWSQQAFVLVPALP